MNIIDEMANALPLGSDPDPYEIAQAAFAVMERRLLSERAILKAYAAGDYKNIRLRCANMSPEKRNMTSLILAIRAALEAVKEGE